MRVKREKRDKPILLAFWREKRCEESARKAFTTVIHPFYRSYLARAARKVLLHFQWHIPLSRFSRLSRGWDTFIVVCKDWGGMA
jgi:hypothetical protein